MLAILTVSPSRLINENDLFRKMLRNAVVRMLLNINRGLGLDYGPDKGALHLKSFYVIRFSKSLRDLDAKPLRQNNLA